MRLKRLEAYGFKSFAEKTEIEFDSGITAVVGPNGSGKSNITDAIKWVLGEQNVRNLRGTRAEDVIFKGSSTRRALGIAEASLTFANENDLPVPYEEVIITRRLYRSGESEFFINKARCRLKDIHALLADTGLGRDGVSVIGQNHIDNILNSRPEERRLFFEETAGVTKYKGRKLEAVRRLDETDANLLRVRDILVELSSRLEPLAEQAEKAKKYNELQSDLRKYNLTELCRAHTNLDNGLAEQNILLQMKQDETLAVEAEMRKLEAKEQFTATVLLQMENKLQEKERESNEMRQKLEEVRQAKAVLEERQRQDVLHKQQLEEQILKQSSEKDNTMSEKTELLANREKCLQDKEIAIKFLQDKKKEAHEQADLLRDEEKNAADCGQKLNDLTIKVAEQKEEASLLEQEALFSQDKQNETRQNLAEWQADAAAKKIELEELETAFDLRLSEQKQLQKNISAVQLEIQNAITKQEDNKKQIDNVNVAIHRCQAKLDMLIRLQEGYEGFGHASKAVLQSHEPWRKNVCGAVAELFATMPEYTKALAVALGGSQENIVTEDENTAKQAISFLKNKKAGRATFLPLPSLRVRNRRMLEDLKHSGVIGYFDKLVITAEKYRIVAEWLLGRTILVDNLDNALSLAKKYNYSLRMVTLSGELVNAGGSLTGGYLRQYENNFFSRRQEIEEIKNSIQSQQLLLQRLEQQENEFGKQITDKQNEVHNLQARETDLNVDIAQQSIKVSQQHEVLEGINSQIVNAKDKLEREKQSFADRQAKAVLARRAWRDLTRAKEQAEQAFVCAEEKARGHRQTAEILATEINEAELKNAVLQQEDLRLHGLILLHEKNIRNIEQAMQEAEDSIKAINEAGSLAQGEMLDLQKRLQEIEAGLLLQKDALAALYQERMKKLSEQQETGQMVKAATAKLKSMQDELHKVELQKSKLLFSLEQCDKELREDYNVSYPQAKLECVVLPEAELKINLAEVKRKISLLGTINPHAIEEYEEAKARFEFLQTQSADLNEAKNNLEKLIQEMDAVMTHQFATAFQKIRKYFHETFQVLFGGGNADVYLTDEADILHSGVNINVQVPDKKVQNLIALSGGERSLTVVALLLAFLRFKPAPFSVLDEIDAALDEANIYRFASYVKEFSSKTQFIIVTHRKGTMTAADVMYGVTMETPGVSKIISVKMQDNNQSEEV